MNTYDKDFLDERDRRMEERFQTQKEGVELALSVLQAENQKDFVEFQRRLYDLNHAHEQAREKERDFIGREVYDKQMERIGDDMKALSVEVKTAAEPVASALVDQDKRNNERFQKIESFQNKLLGLALAAPFVSALLLYLVTR